MKSEYLNKIIKTFIFLLLILGLYSSVITGFSWDEYFHHINGNIRFKFYASFGEINQLDFRNIKFYPGLYDTISYSISHVVFLINKKFFINNLAEIMHIINFFFAALSMLGLYLLSKKIFNKRIALIAVLITLLNPFFFGHMGINSKDLIIFFSLIWFCYFFYKYLIDEENLIKNLIYASFFLGFGCGVRLSFPVITIPIFIVSVVFLLNKYKSNYLEFFRRLLLHSLIGFAITVFLVLLCWPHMIIEIQKGNFYNFFSEIVKNTMSWIDGPKVGVINGEFYEVFNTPKTYFLDIIKYRMPFYSTILFIFSIIIFFKKNLSFRDEIANFNIKFLVLIFISFFPIFLALLLSVNIYDNVRLFLFLIPFISLIAAFSVEFLFSHFKNNLSVKLSSIIILILFSLSFYRFIYLAPYQYSYVNFSYPKYSDSLGKFELDYWGASYKELVKEIKKNHTDEEISKFKIGECGGGDFTLIYYMSKYLGLNKTYSDSKINEATHIVMNNRAFLDVFDNDFVKELVSEDGVILVSDMEKIVRAPNVKKMCYDHKLFSGAETAFVSRGGLPLTVFRKIER